MAVTPMTGINARARPPLLRAVLLCLLGAGLAGCAPVRAIISAATPLDAYTLTSVTPAAPAAAPSRGAATVEVFAATSAVATDRILVKPSPLQVQFLPGIRWVEPAPELIRNLMIDSLQDTGAFRQVGGGGGAFPDYAIRADLRHFEAIPLDPAEPVVYRIRVVLRVTLMRELDGVILGTRLFQGEAETISAEGIAVAAGFDEATGSVLRSFVGWTLASAAAGV